MHLVFKRREVTLLMKLLIIGVTKHTPQITASDTTMHDRYEMTVNYWMILKRYQTLNGVVDGLIPSRDIFYLLDEKTIQVVNYFMYFTNKKEKKKQMETPSCMTSHKTP